MTAQPGPEPGASVDPSARLYLTFNQAILAGPCFTGDYGMFAGACEVTMTPVTSFGRAEPVHLTSIDSELVFAGETLSINPPLGLRPFTNYTVTLTAGTVQGVRGDTLDVE